jgi:hypothetical protein
MERCWLDLPYAGLEVCAKASALWRQDDWVRMRFCSMRFLLPLLLLGFPAFGQLPLAKPIPRLQIIPKPHHIASILLDGKELTTSHFDPQDMRPFWYPIHSSKGVSLTRMGHPRDPHGHSHHNSVWVTHNDLNGVNFWGDRAKTQGRILQVEIPPEGYQDSNDTASIRTVNHWVRDEDKSIQVVEKRHVQILPLDGAKSWFMIVDMEFYPPVGKTATFAASGFGLIAVRVAKSICVNDGGGRLLNSEGLINEKAMFRLPTRWVDYSGRITNEDDGFAGITLMNHPINPQHPTAFHVRDDGWMGACLSLDKPVEITPEKKLRLRYALWVHDGVPTQQESESYWKTFVNMPVLDLNVKLKK